MRAASVPAREQLLGKASPSPMILCMLKHSHGTVELATILPAGQNNASSPYKGYLTRSRSFFPELEE